MKSFISIILITVCSLMGYSQSIQNATIEIKGVIYNHVDHSQVLNPVSGLLVFDTVDNEFWYYDGAVWNSFGVDGISCWDTNGNGVWEGAEDTNGDGSFTAADCQGVQGLQGPAGTNGTNGQDGAQGPAGADGMDGADGIDGQDGAQGPQGIQGLTGPAGLNGTNGTNGVDGMDGTDGIDGQDGAQGPQGIQGLTGPQGVSGVNCWDTNGNGVNDAAEDTNGDGSFNTLDCQGPVSGLPQSPMTGEMTYWDGTAWVSVPTGTDGQSLTLCYGIPTWTTNGICPTPNVTSPTGIIWMDRNLGATQVASSPTDVASYGDLYQWGRGTDGHQIRTSGTTTVLSTTDQPGHGDFILAPNGPLDWRSGQNNNLWQGVNGVNNPCPNGYRVPTEAEWDQERLSWSTNNAAGAFASPLKLSRAGYRNGDNGLLNNVGNVGNYWSSTISGPYARNLYFFSSNSSMATNSRASGLAVRCLKD